MKLTQAWVGYVDRSYEQIKKSLLLRLGVQAPEITDHSESNPLIILVSMFAGVAEVIHLYLDSLAREAFLGTARKYSSAVKLVRLIDYNVKARSYATVNELITLIDTSSGLPTTLPGDVLIPVGTLVFPLNSTVPFKILQDCVLKAGSSNVYASMGQFTQLVNQILGTTSAIGDPNQSFLLSNKYVHNSIEITINGENWPLYNSFGLMGTTTKGAVVQIDENGDAYLVFGDGINGLIPGNSLDIFVNYKETEGVLGNLAPGSITQLQSTITLPSGFGLTFTNPDYSSGGADFENLEQIRNLAPRSIRTLDRAVTYQDYIDVALQVLGVGAAEVKYCCGKYVDVYIAPNSKGTATAALVNRVKNYMDCRVMLTTRVDVKPAGVTRIWIKAKIYGKPLQLSADILAQVLDKLDTEFGAGNIEINRKVSITDIISVVEGLTKVDTIEIEEVRIEPYARPQGTNVNVLNITYPVLPHTTTKIIYALIYKTAGNEFHIYKNGIFLATVATGATYADGGIISFTPDSGSYSDNDKWEFTVFPSYPEIFPDTIINVNDYSAPIIDISPFIDDGVPRTIYGDLEIIEQASSVSCLPSCE